LINDGDNEEFQLDVTFYAPSSSR